MKLAKLCCGGCILTLVRDEYPVRDGSNFPWRKYPLELRCHRRRDCDRRIDVAEREAVIRFHRKHHVPRQHEPRFLCRARGHARRNIISCNVRVKNVDSLTLDKSRNTFCAEHPKRIADRHVQEPLGRQKVEPRLPLIRRPERDKYLMAALGYLTSQIDNVPLAAAKDPRR